MKTKAKALLLSLMIAANGFAQGVVDVHSHLITPDMPPRKLISST